MRKAIQHAKRKCWKELANELDGDIWGSAYQIVRDKHGANYNGQRTNDDMIREVRSLSPKKREIIWRHTPVLDFGHDFDKMMCNLDEMLRSSPEFATRSQTTWKGFWWVETTMRNPTYLPPCLYKKKVRLG